MARSRIAAVALFLAGCLALATAGIYIAFILEHGTDIGHWRYLETAVFDAVLVGTPALLIPASLFA